MYTVMQCHKIFNIVNSLLVVDMDYETGVMRNAYGGWMKRKALPNPSHGSTTPICEWTNCGTHKPVV